MPKPTDGTNLSLFSWLVLQSSISTFVNLSNSVYIVNLVLVVEFMSFNIPSGEQAWNFMKQLKVTSVYDILLLLAIFMMPKVVSKSQWGQ